MRIDLNNYNNQIYKLNDGFYDLAIRLESDIKKLLTLTRQGLIEQLK